MKNNLPDKNKNHRTNNLNISLEKHQNRANLIELKFKNILKLFTAYVKEFPI